VLRVAGLALRQAKLDGRDRVELARREGRESGTYATSIPPLFRSDVA
jgi:hypothetical protein